MYDSGPGVIRLGSMIQASTLEFAKSDIQTAPQSRRRWLHRYQSAGRPSSSLLRLFVLATTALLVDLAVRPPSVSGCIMLLDGWTPMTPGERAVLADIVAYGVVRRTFRDIDDTNERRSPSQSAVEGDGDSASTYTAEVNLVRIVKGRGLVEAIDRRRRVGGKLQSEPAIAAIKAHSSSTSFEPDETSTRHRRRIKRVAPPRVNTGSRVSPTSERSPAPTPTRPLPRTTMAFASTPTATISTVTTTMTRKKTDSGVDVSATRWPRGGRLYNITNFGDSSACYADVANDADDDDEPSEQQQQQQEPRRHVFFLTTFDGHLSARYDDLFGAAADWSRDAEEEIDDALGWTPWSDWSACGTTCGGGIQKRWRLCTDELNGCEGENEHQRRCNEFRCKGSKDLLALTAITSLPLGIRRADERPTAYVIDRASSINTPLAKVVPHGFPANFSLLVTARQKLAGGADGGYLLTLNNLFGFVDLGVRLGRSIRLELSDRFVVRSTGGATPLGDPGDGRGVVTVEFPVDLVDGAWHQVAVAVQTGSHVTLYVDCHVIATQRWRYRASNADRPMAEDTEDGVVTIGRSFIENSRYPQYEGDVEQLTLAIDNTEAATQQCENIDEFSDLNSKSADGDRSLDAETTDGGHSNGGRQVPVTPLAIETAWSDWSSCSATCGAGVEARVLYCKMVSAINDGVVQRHSPEDATQRVCPDDVAAKTETRPCTAGDPAECSAAVRCRRPCFNGGTCLPDGECYCSPGYFGRHCQLPSCYPVCRNGGHCIAPNRCSCRPGYSGDHCQLAKCRTECRNGGWCVRPGQCACPRGFQPPNCSPICEVPCLNGGTCAAHNRCRCRYGYSGNLCETALCRMSCDNGGRCIAPNRCSCPANFTGQQCRRPMCNPECLNGGICVSPGTCHCPVGTYGSSCEHFACSPPCVNNGICIGLNTCLCSASYSGEFCQNENCSRGCQNGGTCFGGNLCRCVDGFEGPTCGQRKCRRETVKITYQRPYNKLVAKQVTYKCGMFGWKTCTKTKYEYQTDLKPAQKTIERCT